MMRLLRCYFPIGPYQPRHWLDTDRRGAWLVPVCMGACFLALWAPLFLWVLRG